MTGAGVEPGDVLKMLARDTHFDCDKAAAIFKSMMNAGVVPDLLTYTLVIKGYVP